MSATIYFNDKGTNYKAEWVDENYPENPRNENVQTNLGTMVFAENGRYDLGDEQVDDFSDFFKTQLSEKDFPSYTDGSIIFDFPDVEDAKKDPRLVKFVAGSEEYGYRFDKEFFAQEMDYALSNIRDDLGADICEELDGGIPLHTDGSFENWYTINFKTPYGKTDYSEIKNAIEEELSKYGLKITSIHPEEINQLEDLSEKELYKKWAETKACVIPLSLYEHSELTVHTSGEKYDVSGEIANSGFIYIDKDNPEFLNELKGEARDRDGTVYNKWTPKTEEEAKKWAEGVLKGEIEDYAAYLEGNVHDIRISYFDKEKMEWINNDYEGMIYGSSLEKNLSEHGFDTSNKLTSTQLFTLENSVNPEFKDAVGKEYIEAVKKELADFDNNPKLAATSVSKQWAAKEDVNVETYDRVNRWSLKKQALNEYLKDNGCDSPEKIFSFLAEKVGAKKVEHNLEPLNVPSQVLSKSNIGGKITTLSSAKKVDEKARELLRNGFKSTEIDNKALKPYQKDISKKGAEKEGRER